MYHVKITLKYYYKHFSAGARLAVNLQNSSHKPGVPPADPGGPLLEGCSLSQQHTRGRRDGLYELLASHASS